MKEKIVNFGGHPSFGATGTPVSDFHFSFYRTHTEYGEGNVFTGACHSVHRGGGLPSHNAMGRQTNQRVVRILLECILVFLFKF